MAGANGSRRPPSSDTPAGVGGAPRRTSSRRVAPPLEHRILMTAALCLLAFGAVMVYSASSPLGVLSAHGGSGAGQLIRYLAFGSLGLVAMLVLERRGLALLTPQICRLLLLGSFALLLLVLIPGFGVTGLGARRWFSLGPIQFQPSEVMKLALVLYVARYLADHPKRMRSCRHADPARGGTVDPAHRGGARSGDRARGRVHGGRADDRRGDADALPGAAR